MIKQILIVDGNLIAFGPFTTDENNITGPDMVFPKNISLNWKIVEAEIEDGKTIVDFTFNGTGVVLKISEPVLAPVPESVSPRQIRQALTRVNLRTSVESAIAAGDQDTKDWYEYATAFERTNPHVAMMGQALSVSGAQLDDLWRLAGSL